MSSITTIESCIRLSGRELRQAKPFHRAYDDIYVFFEVFKLYEPNECDHNFMDIFGAGTDLRNLISHYCGSVADPLVSPSNLIHLRFFALERARETQFRVWYTSFRDSNQTGEWGVGG
ncbi:Neuropilin and tolloid-like protein 2 [Portunus trituberculatus]|uniref:Neuropilin and tolloid-like protein 2 n=1 Tax=Portunus trituberculatus TaxID=210409 RepID=A0A5B7GNU0_PORTR|nr:Neuropilin and tolloid-like protein 2 [Portunus trituberculatus]